MASSFSALIALGRPPRVPRRRAASSPARMRSCVKARSYWASAPKTRNRQAPCGVVVSICSVREQNATPCAWRVVRMCRRCDSERPSRSSFQTTRQSPDRTEASACWNPGRASRPRWPYLQTDAVDRRRRRARRRVAGLWSAGRCPWKSACTPRAYPRNSLGLVAVSPSNPTGFPDILWRVLPGVSTPCGSVSGITR